MNGLRHNSNKIGQIEMKKAYLREVSDQIKLWRNADNPREHFLELNIKFTRSLDHTERNQAIAYFVAGLDQLDATAKYVIYMIDFSKPDFLQLIFQHVALDRTRAWLQLLVEFRKKFPVSPAKRLMDLNDS